MQLNEILEEHSVKSISIKTNISEDNIEMLLAEDYASLSKAKALGFISIIERDYDADLSKKREEALAYYEVHSEDQSMSLGLPMIEEKKGRSKWGVVLVLALLAYASWYFFTQFDNKNLSDMLPFTEKKVENSLTPKENSVPEEEVEKSLSIENALSNTQTDATGVQTDIIETTIEPRTVTPQTEERSDINVSTDEPRTPQDTITASIQNIILMPENRLWFGVIEIGTGKRDHFSISDKYEIDVKEKSWLLATSTAPFSFIMQDETQEYNDAKEHYFKVSKEGIESLDKVVYVSLGGYKKW